MAEPYFSAIKNPFSKVFYVSSSLWCRKQPREITWNAPHQQHSWNFLTATLASLFELIQQPFSFAQIRGSHHRQTSGSPAFVHLNLYDPPCAHMFHFCCVFCRPCHSTESPPSLYTHRPRGRERVKMWRGVFEVWRALWSTPFHSPASNIRPFLNKPLWQSHADPPQHTHPLPPWHEWAADL